MAESLKNIYANALFDLCEEKGITAQADEELFSVSKILSENEEYIKLLRSPLLDISVKKSLIEAAFGESVCETVLDFLCLVTEKGRAGSIEAISREFRRLWYEKQGILEVSVVTAMPMSEALEQKLKDKLEKVLEKKIIMKLSVDKSLIGGIIVRYDGSEMDSSVKGRLERLRAQIDGIIA